MSDKRREFWIETNHLGGMHLALSDEHKTQVFDQWQKQFVIKVVELQPHERIFSRESLRQWLFNTLLEDANFGVHTIQVIEANLNELFASTGEK